MKKKNTMMENAKDTIKLGGVSMVGMGALGAIGAVPGMPAQASQVTQVAGAGLGLANVGQLAKTGMGLVDMMGTTKKKTGNKYIDKII